MDRINAKWTPNDATYVTVGRQGVALDVTGTFWDEDAVFDGVAAGWDNGKVGVEAGYGRFKDAWKVVEDSDPEVGTNWKRLIPLKLGMAS